MEERAAEISKSKRKAYYEANKEALNAKNKEYREKNKEEINKQRKEYRQNNKDKIAERDKDYRSRKVEQTRLRSAKWYANNRDRSKNSRLLRKYNISLDEYNKMLLEQDGKCWTCSTKAEDERNKVLVVDHNHLTGEVRGLLCNRCNTAIGLLQESQEILEKVSKYLHEKGTCTLNEVG
jgi:hypothetical protein